MNLANEKILAKTDQVLEKIILQVPRPIIGSKKNVFHDLVSCIIEQQIHYRSTKKMFEKALALAGIEQLTIENFHLLEKHSLSHLKLAMGKYEAIHRFVEYWGSNNLDFLQLTEEQIISELSSLKGISKWTIDMILLYTLERTNIFPNDDFHLKKIMVSLYGLNPNTKLKSQMIEISEKWENQKSLAVLYLLALKQYNKSL